MYIYIYSLLMNNCTYNYSEVNNETCPDRLTDFSTMFRWYELMLKVNTAHIYIYIYLVGVQ